MIEFMTWHDAVGDADWLEARLALARVALEAYRGGIESAQKLATTMVDPYDGQPIRCATGPGTELLIWSVGPDKMDDHGDPGDLPWKLALR
jgi:hypothetical protein